MKKFLLPVLALSLLAGCAKEEEKTVEIKPSDFVGTWAIDRASMEVEQTANNSFNVTVDWSSSAFESSNWTYECNFDETNKNLTCDGSRTDIAGTDEGNLTSTSVYNDGSAKFSFVDEKIKWEDSKEDIGKDLLFERVTE